MPLLLLLVGWSVGRSVSWLIVAVAVVAVVAVVAIAAVFDDDVDVVGCC